MTFEAAAMMPELRRWGYGRAAVVLNLFEARLKGVKKTITFVANKFATHAYRGIGFEQIRSYLINLFKDPED